MVELSQRTLLSRVSLTLFLVHFFFLALPPDWFLLDLGSFFLAGLATAALAGMLTENKLAKSLR